MNNLIEQIKKGVETGEITVNQLKSLTNELSATTPQGKQDKTNIVTKVLFGIGGLIVLVGVIVLLSQNWDAIGVVGRLLSTLGIAIVSHVLAFYTFKTSANGQQSVPENQGVKAISAIPTQVYFAISAVLFPLGLNILLSELAFYDTVSVAVISILISLISLLVFASALYVTKKKVLHVFSAIFATWLIYSIVAEMLRGTGFRFGFIKDTVVFTSMVIALGYFAYGHWLKVSQKEYSISKLFTFASFVLFLFSALFLGGIWNFLYAFIVIGAISLSVSIRSTATLVVSSIAVAIYLIKISAQYFAGSISWSLLLVLIGFLIIGLGYVTYYLNKKYINNEKRQG